MLFIKHIIQILGAAAGDELLVPDVLTAFILQSGKSRCFALDSLLEVFQGKVG